MLVYILVHINYANIDILITVNCIWKMKLIISLSGVRELSFVLHNRYSALMSCLGFWNATGYHYKHVIYQNGNISSFLPIAFLCSNLSFRNFFLKSSKEGQLNKELVALLFSEYDREIIKGRWLLSDNDKRKSVSFF